MNFMLIPSLEHVALVSVAASLWDQQDVRTLVTEFTNSPLFLKLDKNLHFHKYISTKRKEAWVKIEEKVIKKVPQLTVPTILKQKILGFVQAVGLQILNWMEYHHRYMDFFNFGLPNQFFWTPQGTVDRKKTAEVLIKDENIGIVTRYKFACIYCLENNVPELWNRLPESIQKYFADVENLGKNMQTDLLIFWGMHLHGEVARLGSIIRQRLDLKCSAYRYMFRSAANGGNKAATEYFLQKLFLRKKSLFKTALYVAKSRRDCLPRITDPPKEYSSEVVCYLLSQMNDAQQVKLFKKSVTLVLYCFLDWPWQNFFIYTASFIWSVLPIKNFHCIFSMIIHKVIFRCNDYNYQKLIRELWQQAPHSHKRFILHDSIGGLFGLLFEINDRESLKLMIQDATLAEKNKLMFSNIGRGLCEAYISQLDLLKFFLQLIISSKNEMIKFKQEYEEHDGQRCRIGEDMRTQFLKLLDDLIRGYDKRSADGGDSSAPKRLRTIHLNDTPHDTKNRRRRSI